MNGCLKMSDQNISLALSDIEQKASSANKQIDYLQDSVLLIFSQICNRQRKEMEEVKCIMNKVGLNFEEVLKKIKGSTIADSK